MKREDLESDGMEELWCEWFICEKCKDEKLTKSSNYCPNCGEEIIN